MPATPLGQPATPGVRYRRWRTVAFDGCSSIKAPDSTRNRPSPGKIKYRLGWAGYPRVMLMALAETGTRGLLGAVFGPATDGETVYAARLTHLLDRSMLVLLDRGFDGNDFLVAVAGTGAAFLARLTSTRRPPIMAKLPDGSYLSRLGSLKVRIIEADLTIHLGDGSTLSGRYRPATTLTDHRRDPAAALIRLYHERWEIESAFYALRHTVMRGRVLRSADPAGIEQELWALLVLYQALRMAMVCAVESVPGTDPDRAGFTTALETARDTVTAAHAILPATSDDGTIDLIGRTGRAVLADLLPPRRPRICARKVTCPISRYHAKPADDDRPLTATTISAIDITIRDLQPVPESGRPAPTPPPTSSAAADPHDPPRLTRKQRILDLLAAGPTRAWHARDLARELGAADVNSFATQLSAMARKGQIHKIAKAMYMLQPTPAALHIPRQRPPHNVETIDLTLARMI
ncbi:transposase [Microbispora sp. NBC_01189]|uniref:transposase n=1 Tax=Microbispora sp. NBC_01189 TaxID=2903583 RepID=UPI002E12A0E8|nr:transposase [Microbispora sp. NBC_01189]